MSGPRKEMIAKAAWETALHDSQRFELFPPLQHQYVTEYKRQFNPRQPPLQDTEMKPLVGPRGKITFCDCHHWQKTVYVDAPIERRFRRNTKFTTPIPGRLYRQ
ncbi:uncharacterized protein LOC132205455 [Neocloeon triangulifer]|uniref:uncharacterized protein LOC132205455 n=1 Tax=Neocloeon triangulifer TaxID=2078957 RepID=UPI00286F2DE1|nr:uncharacterized protein LOC132205455 [Neocloeon triangulifer]